MYAYVCMIYEILGMVAAGMVTRMSWDIYVWIPFGDHPLKLERYREDYHGQCARVTRTNQEV